MADSMADAMDIDGDSYQVLDSRVAHTPGPAVTSAASLAPPSSLGKRKRCEDPLASESAMLFDPNMRYAEYTLAPELGPLFDPNIPLGEPLVYLRSMTREEAREFWYSPPPPYKRALRRVRGCFVTLVTSMGSCLAQLWARFTKGATKRSQEIIAIETDMSGKKRRAVMADHTSSPSKKKASPVPKKKSVMPGNFPQAAPQEIVKHDSPMEFTPAVPQENELQQTEQQTTDTASISAPLPQENESHTATSTTTTAAPAENVLQQTEQQTTDTASISAPLSQENASHTATTTTTAAAPVRRRSFDWKPKGHRLHVKTMENRAAAAGRAPAPVPFPRRTRPWPQNLRRSNGMVSPPAQHTTQRDTDVDALVSRARRAAIETPEEQALRQSLRERKAQQEAAEEVARQQLEAFAWKKGLSDEEQAEKLKREEAEFPAWEDMPDPDDKLEPDHKADSQQEQEPKLIRPLDAAWVTKIDEAMQTKSRTSTLCSTADGTELKRHDFGSLLPQTGTEDAPSGWLNDEIVNAWMSTIVARKLEQTGYKKAAGNVPAYVAYSSMWYTNYKKPGAINNIKNWSRRKNVQGAKLLQAEKIFFPVNTGVHWMLLIISPGERNIAFLDSLGKKNSATAKKFFSVAREWLEMELGEKYDAGEWHDATEMESAQQGNSDDCGVFVCMNGLASGKGLGFSLVESGDMSEARRMMAAVLLNGGLKDDFEL